MFAPTPPRCTTSSSTRKDRDTLCICSSRNCSLKRPGNFIRMSVAIDAATAICMLGSPRRVGGRVPDWRIETTGDKTATKDGGIPMGDQVLVTGELHDYMLDHGMPLDAVARDLVEETRALGGVSRMLTTADQAALLTILTRLVSARRAIEIGTFTGFSALAIARGLPADGSLICLDVSEEW